MREHSASYDQSRSMDERAWWDLWNKSHRTKDSNDSVSSELFQRIAAVINGITSPGTSRILEVACGAGDVSRLLSCSSYQGLDISPAAIEIAQQKAKQSSPAGQPPVLHYEAADFHEWALPEEQFDLVVCVDAIVCFRDQNLVISKMARLLRPGGRLVITAINPFVYYRIKKSWENGPVSHWLNREELCRLVESGGFDIEQSYTIMPRGNLGILRLMNARRVDLLFGPRIAAQWRRLKERMGLGQYRVIVARKSAA